jgi:hypothetical protein
MEIDDTGSNPSPKTEETHEDAEMEDITTNETIS